MNQSSSRPSSKLWLVVVVVAVLFITPWPILALAPAHKGEWFMVAVPVDNEMRVAPMVGRSPSFAIVNVKTGNVKLVANPYQRAEHGAGLNCARLLSKEQVGVLIVQDIGPEPFKHLTGRGVAVYTGKPTTVAEAVAQLKAGMLAKVTAATVSTHFGLRTLGGASAATQAPCPMSGTPSLPPPSPVVAVAPVTIAPATIAPAAVDLRAPSSPQQFSSITPGPAESQAPPFVGPFQVPRLALEVVGSGRGVSVFRVYTGGVAQQAGLRPGDLVLGLGVARIIDVANFIKAVAQAPEEQTVNLEVFRQGRTFRTQVTLGEGEMETVTLPRSPAPLYSQPPAAPIAVQGSGPSIAIEPLGVQATDASGGGALVVVAAGAAAKAGVRVGDVITNLGNQAIAGARQLQQAVSGAPTASRWFLTLTRGGQQMVLAVPANGGTGIAANARLP